jgi:hypothetical protein
MTVNDLSLWQCDCHVYFSHHIMMGFLGLDCLMIGLHVFVRCATANTIEVISKFQCSLIHMCILDYWLSSRSTACWINFFKCGRKARVGQWIIKVGFSLQGWTVDNSRLAVSECDTKAIHTWSLTSFIQASSPCWGYQDICHPDISHPDFCHQIFATRIIATLGHLPT